MFSSNVLRNRTAYAVTISAILALTANSAFADLLVSDHWNHRVARFDQQTGAYKGTVASVDRPQGLAYGPDGNLYIADSIANSVLRFDGKTDASLGYFIPYAGAGEGNDMLFGPDGNLYLGESGWWSGIRRFDGHTGQNLGVFATGASLDQSQHLTFGPDGNLYVSSTKTNDVLRFNGQTGAYMNTVLQGGNIDGANGIVFGPDGNLYIASWANHRVVRYDFATQSQSIFADDPSLDHPNGIVFGPDSDLYVASQFGNRILRIDHHNGRVTTFIEGGLYEPLDLIFTPPVPEPSCLALPALLALTCRRTLTRPRHH